MMNDKFTLLIADQNRHVRGFLRREFIAEGFGVEVAGDGQEVLKMIDADEPPDLLILDPDLPYVDGLQILEKLQERNAHLPVVIHSFNTEPVNQLALQSAAAFVEKMGNNIDHLKDVVLEVLRKFYPHQF